MDLISQTVVDGVAGPGAPPTYPTLKGVDLADIFRFTKGQPFADFARMREQAPVMWHPEPFDGPGFWALTRYEDVHRVNGDPETFSSQRGGILMSMGAPEKRHALLFRASMDTMINMDAPHHLQLPRRPLLSGGRHQWRLGRGQLRLRLLLHEHLQQALDRGDLLLERLQLVGQRGVVCEPSVGELRIDDGQQLLGLERLAHIRGGARAVPGDPVVREAARGEEYDRHAAQPRVGTHALEQLVAVEARHGDVGDDEVGKEAFCDRVEGGVDAAERFRGMKLP